MYVCCIVRHRYSHIPDPAIKVQRDDALNIVCMFHGRVIVHCDNGKRKFGCIEGVLIIATLSIAVIMGATTDGQRGSQSSCDRHNRR